MVVGRKFDTGRDGSASENITITSATAPITITSDAAIHIAREPFGRSARAFAAISAIAFSRSSATAIHTAAAHRLRFRGKRGPSPFLGNLQTGHTGRTWKWGPTAGICLAVSRARLVT